MLADAKHTLKAFESLTQPSRTFVAYETGCV